MAKILYIDDDALMTEIMVDGLTQAGKHEVHYEKSASGAAEIIRSKEKFDVIILDMMMRKGPLVARPGEAQTGHILYRLIREQRPSTPIIVLTVLKVHQAGAALRADPRLTWIRKPVELVDLNARIAESLCEV